jgi:serine/threonine-protein kinase RsbW
VKRRRARAGEDAQVERQLEGPYTAVFPARRDALPRVCAFVEDSCERAAVPPRDSLRLTLLIEELFTNTVVHGHGRDTEAPVRLALTRIPSAVAVEYEDTARPFNPLAVARPPTESVDVDHHHVGGLGITLITTMAEELRYAWRDGKNQIQFQLRLSGA